MKKLSILMDYVACSLNEILDLVIHSILFSLIMSYIIGGVYDFAYSFLFVIPFFILLSPLIKNIHKRHIVEWIVKVPGYLFVGVITYTLSYYIMGTAIAESGRTTGWTISLVIVILIQSYWIRSTLRNLAKEPLSLEARREKSKKSRILSFVFSVCSVIVSISAFSSVFSPGDTPGDWSVLGDLMGQIVGVVIGVVFLIIAFVLLIYFILSFLDRT